MRKTIRFTTSVPVVGVVVVVGGVVVVVAVVVVAVVVSVCKRNLPILSTT